MKVSFALILVHVLCSSCAHQTRIDGVQIYDHSIVRSQYNYSLQEGVPERINQLLKLSLDYWNRHIGEPRLRFVDDASMSHVKLGYTEVSTVHSVSSHTEMAGCLSGGNLLADCRIQIDVPTIEALLAEMGKLAHLYSKGPLDAFLLKHIDYDGDSRSYLHDKYVFITMIHEIGHSIGLGHAEDINCLMAEAPLGQSTFCESELNAVRRQLHLAGKD